ncbi:MAG: hypothetical protein B9J98_06730 [Candidatus Terraquivivens tikiterensis]|uniref:Uncharacterized protein n=1 Tax=Candidatus Terraquivivens tikiterensis TaxID=1980982 RepID=A0A2R7Y1N0_9ARCH|nr:MAG: hypothetical protein B9J98_06730 [Candidatus Terraquivivens tikiterensis]
MGGNPKTFSGWIRANIYTPHPVLLLFLGAGTAEVKPAENSVTHLPDILHGKDLADGDIRSWWGRILSLKQEAAGL